MIADLRDVLRRLIAEPACPAIAIVTLALGIGANTAIFSLIKTVLIRPLPYDDPERVVVIWNTREADSTTWLSEQEIFSYRHDASTLEGVAAIYETEINSREDRSLSGSGSRTSRRTCSRRLPFARCLAGCSPRPTVSAVGRMWWCSPMVCGSGGSGRTRTSSASRFR